MQYTQFSQCSGSEILGLCYLQPCSKYAYLSEDGYVHRCQAGGGSLLRELNLVSWELKALGLRYHGGATHLNAALNPANKQALSVHSHAS